MSDVFRLSGITRLSFDSTLLPPLLFFCRVLCLFLSCLFFCLLAHSDFFQKILQYFSLSDSLFLHVSCLAARRSKLVSGVCSMLPYDTDICCYAFFFVLLLSILLHTFIRRNGPRYQHILALYAFITGAIPKGQILRKFCV